MRKLTGSLHPRTLDEDGVLREYLVYLARPAGEPVYVASQFCTHLLEAGTDIRYIQALLGHESTRTTERVTHVTKGAVSRLVSPLDRISGGENF